MPQRPHVQHTPAPAPADDPSTGLNAASRHRLAQRDAAGQRRALRTIQPKGKWVVDGGEQLLNLAGNDYLALSSHPRLIEAAVQATRSSGVGSGASRLVAGTGPIHEQAERRFAAFKHAEAALLLATGYTANLAVLTTLAGKGDLIVLDKLVHASLIDAARASGAEVRTYPHLNLDRAEHLLTRPTRCRRLLVTDSVFSMDGDCADLPAMCVLADRCDAVLVVDEAHGTGVLGADGSGLGMAQGVAERVYACGAGGVVVSTASKALGGLGGVVTAAGPVIDWLVNEARPFIYSTAVPPAQGAALVAALDVVRDEPQRRARLAELSGEVRDRLAERGWPVDVETLPTPIVPLVVGGEQAALSLSAHLREQGVFAPAIRPPTVAPGTSRVRLSLRADLADEDIDHLFDAIGSPPDAAPR